MTEREARIAFNLVPDVGAVKLASLMREAGGSAAEAWERWPDKTDWRGQPVDWKGELARAGRQNVTILTAVDADYPARLCEIASPPLALYVVGDPKALSAPSVAIVGTRACTPYGLGVAEHFAHDLARAGWGVLSGLAVGIDAAAHRGALAGGGVTVGVLGGALDEFFPSENRKLARDMVERGGAVVSEFPFGRKPDRQTFPQRNRIVSALSRGVLAVETGLRGGTLITCNLALEQGRLVMAVPGRIDAAASAGCNRLVRDGATMVTSVDDVIEALTELKDPLPLRRETAEPAAPPRRRSSPAAAPAAEPEAKVSLEESLVLKAVSDEGESIDAVVRASGLAAAKVNALLVALRLKRRVKFLPGNRVARA